MSIDVYKRQLFQMGSKNIEVGANPVGLTNAITDLTNRQNIRANAALNWEIIKGCLLYTARCV